MFYVQFWSANQIRSDENKFPGKSRRVTKSIFMQERARDPMILRQYLRLSVSVNRSLFQEKGQTLLKCSDALGKYIDLK